MTKGDNPKKVKLGLTFDPDRPISDAKVDRLGFGDIAESLAQSVASSSASKGFVIGIEGRWGSGKSSILNLLAARLQGVKDLSVLRFDPWIVGDRDSMAATLIGDLATAIEAIAVEAGGTVKKIEVNAVELAKQLRVYGANASRGLAKIAKLASVVGIPGSELAAKGLEVTSQLLDGVPSSKPLSTQRSELFDALEALGHRFVVLVDDLDRLEPAEAAEITRLIRAVGDFPNVVYLLCYDKDVLAKSLKKALGVADGHDFLRKIVQVSFRVPRPEEFDLRRWLLSECFELYQSVHGQSLSKEDVAERLAQVCDKEGGFLQTPRDIALILNALRLVYPPVANKVDFADICWLQIVRTTNENLYRWVEHYLDLFAAVSGRYGMVHESERRSLAENLLQCLDAPTDHSSASSVWRVSEIIPGISGLFDSTDKELYKQVLKDVGANRLALLEQQHRLGSPQHYRFYFSFSLPAGALDDEIFQEIVFGAEQGSDISGKLRSLVETPRRLGGTMYGVFLDRLGRSPALQEDTLKRLILAVGDTVEDAERKQPRGGPFGQRDNWRRAHEILRQGLSGLKGKVRKQFISDVFGQAKSIGWLLGQIIGRELFDHGRVGNPRALEEHRMLSPNELDTAISIVSKRLEGRDGSRIIEVPELMGFLYRWKQSGGDMAMRAWVSSQSKRDGKFLELLDGCRGWRASDKIQYPLNKRDVSIFIDFDAMVARLKRISKKKKVPNSVRSKARELLEAAELGRKDVGSDE